MRILIVEDEKVAARGLEKALRSRLGDAIESLKIQNTLTAAECFIEDHAIDLLFLDLNLDGEDGFDLLQHVAAAAFQTIIVSAHTHRSLEAFEYGVLDFLPKPVQSSRLARALARFQEKASRKEIRYLTVKVDESVERIAIDAIHYIESDDNYVLIKTKSGETFRHRKTMDALMALLPESYLRIHRKYLVDRKRIQRVRSIPGSQYRAELDDGSILPVSRQIYGREFASD